MNSEHDPAAEPPAFAVHAERDAYVAQLMNVHHHPRSERVVPRHLARRWMWPAAIAAVVLVGAVAVVVFVWRESGDPFPRLVLAPAPSSQDWTAQHAPCTAQTTWRHRFDDSYRGDVYAQLAPSTPPAITAVVTLTWGGLHWRGTTTVQPGVLDRGQGGTLLRFIKKDSVRSNPADWNPGVKLDSSVPLCATFGTAHTRPRPAPITYLETPGWTPN